jgi:hypothetical protein
VWYSRMGQPDRENMKKRVAKLGSDCDITVDDVDCLPWMLHGQRISVKEMNDLIHRNLQRGHEDIVPDTQIEKLNACEVMTRDNPNTAAPAYVKENEVPQEDYMKTPPSEPETIPKKKKERKILTPQKAELCYAWYSRMGQPDRETMKKRVAKLGNNCDITVDDVDCLPWMMNGLRISVKAMNELIHGSLGI